MSLLESIKNNIIFIASKAIKANLDGKEIGKKLDKKADKTVGKKTSEKIQRGPFTNLLLEILEGLYDENPGELVVRLRSWAHDLERKLQN